MTVSIIIPAYNSEKHIKRCIDSALNQVTKYKYKIVVVNDGSKDYTRMKKTIIILKVISLKKCMTLTLLV